jgi:hypothetical protein
VGKNMSIADIKLLLSKTIDTRTLVSPACDADFRAKMSARLKGKQKSKEWQDKISKSLTKRIFRGKSVNQWCEILGGDKGEIRKHIKNGTMLEYTPYRKYIGLKSIKNKHCVKQLMTPKGIMTYEQAKAVFGWSQSETVRNRVRSDDYPDWYEICVK